MWCWFDYTSFFFLKYTHYKIVTFCDIYKKNFDFIICLSFRSLSKKKVFDHVQIE